ncbi:MAG: hypothetical protein IE909_14915, partial [Campylobacterales bacterium]|nr:hypothetical protein [Campylobacterales bacterium]
DQNLSSGYSYYDVSDDFDINNLNSGWNFLGTSKPISLEKLNDATVVWSFENNQWYGYSTKYDLNEYSINQLETIDSYSGFWIYK